MASTSKYTTKIWRVGRVLNQQQAWVQSSEIERVHLKRHVRQTLFTQCPRIIRDGPLLNSEFRSSQSKKANRKVVNLQISLIILECVCPPRAALQGTKSKMATCSRRRRKSETTRGPTTNNKNKSYDKIQGDWWIINKDLLKNRPLKTEFRVQSFCR